MSGEAKTELTEAEIQENIDKDLEAAQDEAFGSDVEISAQAAVEAGTKTQEEVDAELAAQKEKDDEAAAEAEALAKENEGKTPEELEKAAADKKAADDAAAKANESKTPEELAAEKKAADDAAAEEDPYEVPEDMKGRTRERFETLTGKLKEAHGTVEKQEGIIKGFREVIERTGMSPTELQSTLDLGGLIKTNPAKALETLKGVVTDLSAQLGEIPPGANPLDGFDDLKQKVVDREISLEDATVVAAARTKEAASKKLAEQQANQQTEAQQKEQAQAQTQEQFNARVAAAQTSVGEFLVTIQTDPDADRMAPHLIEAAKFAAENLAPEKWMEYIKGEHTKIKTIASAMTPSGSGSTPIMDGGTPPGGDKVPENMEQLADQML